MSNRQAPKVLMMMTKRKVKVTETNVGCITQNSKTQPSDRPRYRRGSRQKPPQSDNEEPRDTEGVEAPSAAPELCPRHSS